MGSGRRFCWPGLPTSFQKIRESCDTFSRLLQSDYKHSSRGRTALTHEQFSTAPATETEEHLAQPSELSEDEIVSGLQLGEQPAWTALYDQYSVPIWRYVARVVGPRAAEVADIVQETFLAAARTARHFDTSKGSLRQWLFGVAHHRVAQYWRAIVREQRLLEAAQPSVEKPASNSADPSRRLEQQELSDVVRAALSALPADYALLLSGKYIDGLSILDLQRQYGGTSDAVRSKLVRAKKAFRQEFENLGKTSSSRHSHMP